MMSGDMIGVICIALALFMILMRLSIGLSLIIVSFLGFVWLLNVKAAASMVASVPFAFVGNWNLSAIPMFLLMGYVASSTGLTTGLFHAARLLLSRLPGGLAVSSVGASGLFAAASGSSVATSAAMAKIATPEMLKHGYHPGLATGVIAAGGTLGSMIPPSILLLLYGYYAEVSVSQLFMAGIIPGILTMMLYSAMIIIRCKLNPSLAPTVDDHPTFSEILAALKDVWPLPVLIISVMIGIFVGVFTPTQAGAIGALVACLIAIARGTMTFGALRNSVEETLYGTAGIFLILIGTTMLTNFLALSGLPASISAGILEADLGVYTLLFGIVIVYILLGMFVDSIGLMLLTLPIIMPLANALGIDLIWLGIIIVKLLEIGLMTPPVGLNVYVISSALGNTIGLNTIFRGVGWFIATDLICLSIIVAFPDLVTWLPRFLM